jgi:zinc protease
MRQLAWLAIGLGAFPAAISAQQPLPPAGPVVPATLPAPQEALLPNGLKLVVLERHRQPIVSVTLSIPAGTAADPERKEGLADMFAALMTRGGGNRSGSDVADLLESVGGSMGAVADPDYLTLQSDIVLPHLPVALELMADAVLRPALTPADVESFRNQTAAALEAGMGETGTLAERVFLLGIYRNHPYARRPSPLSIRAIAREDLLAFQRGRLRPAGSTLVLAGDITLAEARRLALTSFGTWKGLRGATTPPVVPVPAPPGILLVHAGGVREATIIVGGPSFLGADTSYYAAAALNQVLSDARTGRLPQELTAEHPWASGASTSFLRTAGRGVFQATVQTTADAADSALAALYAQLARVRTDLVPARELDRAKEALAGSFALRLQTVGQLASATTEARQLGLPQAYLSTFRTRVMALTAAQVRAVARRVAPERGLLTVVVGDAARLYPALSRFGPVKLFAADGSPLTPEAVQPRRVDLAIHAGGTATRRDSLVILADGKAVGLQVTLLEGAGDSVTYTEETALGNAISQTTRLVFDTTGHMRRLEQAGKARGQDTRIDLTYAAGHVRGTANIATTAGPRTITVDTTVGPGVIDDNGIQAILPYLTYDLNTRWSFEVFASGQGTARAMTLTVADLTRITVPAGAFDCFRVDLTGGPQRIAFYVTSAAPHRVVQVEIAGSPIAFVLVNH